MMKLTKQLSILLLSFIFAACSSADKSGVSADGTEAKIDKLLSTMTVAEKAGQMTQVTLDVITKGKNETSSDEPLELDPEIAKKAIQDYNLGSVLNTGNAKARTREEWHAIVGGIQELAAKSSTQIPVLYGVDAIHGHTYGVGATLFPQQIAQAASWNVEWVERAASITAYETRACGIPWNFSPVLGLGRDPRWPRFWETFGEDVYLGQVMGAAMVRGMQGDDISADQKVVACAKHYLGYSSTLSGKDRTPAWIPEQQLREYFVPAFRSAIEAGALTVMVNSGEINGMPVHANYDILTTLLKDELKFQGFSVTDWQDIEYLHTRHKIADSHKEAVKLAINAGIDMSMVPYNLKFTEMLIELINEKEIPMSRIDDAVRRILRVKLKLGLFDKPKTDIKDYPKYGSAEFAKVSEQIANESITLLQNTDSILPLSKTAKVLVCGPNSNSMRALDGGWSYSWQGEIAEEYTTEFNTIYEAIASKLGTENVLFSEGVAYKNSGAYWEDQVIDIAQTVALAQKADVIVLCLGENSYTEKVGDLEDLYISDNQTQLALALAQVGKPIVLVLNEGRPRIISRFADKMQAIVQAYLPANYGGDAIANILFGDVNPSGKLPYTYPRYPNSLVPYNHKYTEEIKNPGETYSANYNPQFEFGTGLSYTSFEYSNLKLTQAELTPEGELTVSVTLKNTGKRDGKEAVILYVSDLFASTTPEVKRVRAFSKVDLKAGESKEIEFTIKPSDLAFVNARLQTIAEKGEFEVKLANLSAKFTLAQDVVFP